MKGHLGTAKTVTVTGVSLTGVTVSGEVCTHTLISSVYNADSSITLVRQFSIASQVRLSLPERRGWLEKQNLSAAGISFISIDFNT